MSKKRILGSLVLAVVMGAAFGFCLSPCFAESITLTTYYPAPFGVYNEMRSKKMAIGDTYYDSSQHCWVGGSCAFPDINDDADLVIEGNVGIGTTDPSYSLDVYKSNLLPKLSIGIGRFIGSNCGNTTSVTGVRSEAFGCINSIAQGVYSFGRTSGSGSEAYGVYAKAHGVTAYGIYATASIPTFASTGYAGYFDAVVGAIPGTLYAGYFNGHVSVMNGNVGIGTTSPKSKLHVTGLSEYADNAVALAAGLTVGAFYRTGDVLKIVH